VVDLLGYVVGRSGPKGHMVATTPARLYDTRLAVHGGPLVGGEERTVTVAGRGGLPSGSFSGIVANVTATEPTHVGYLTVWPADRARPTASNLNFTPRQTVPNLVISAVSPDGAIKVFAPYGTTHVVIDVVGYID
jgi:hypothetical protein